MADALDAVHHGALALDRMGHVLAANAAAHALFDDEVRISQHRLMVRDRSAGAELANLIDRLRATSEVAELAASPIVARRDGKPALLIRLLPVSSAARCPFLGARALLLLSELRAKPAPNAALVARAFGLTPAEARLASLLATGMAVEAAAQRLGTSPATARTQLKAIFSKTETHRRSELVALLTRLG